MNKIIQIAGGAIALLAATDLRASTQQVITPTAIARQIIEEVRPLMELNHTEQYNMHLHDLLSTLATLVGKVLQVQCTVTQQELGATHRALDAACTTLGATITELTLELGNHNWQKKPDAPELGSILKYTLKPLSWPRLPALWTRLPTFLKYTKNVKDLSLGKNAFAPEEDFGYLEHMSQLSILSLNCDPNDTKVSRLPKFKNTQLAYLDVTGNDLTLTQINEALEGRQKSMIMLRLDRTQTTEQELGLLSAMPNLQILGLRSLELTALPKNFAQTKKQLEVLWLDDNKFTQAGLEPIRGLENLTNLSVQNNGLFDFPSITALKKLQYLTLHGNNFHPTIQQEILTSANLGERQSPVKIEFGQSKEEQ